MLHLKPQSQEHAIILTCDSETLDKCVGSSIKPIKPNPSWFVWYEQTQKKQFVFTFEPQFGFGVQQGLLHLLWLGDVHLEEGEAV